MSTFSQRLEELLVQYDMNKSQLARLMRNDIRVTQKYYLHEQNEVLLNEVNRALGRS